MTPPDPKCVRCGRHPDDIEEYTVAAEEYQCSPAEFVRREEGTYNYRNGHFACTECYIEMGQPSSRGGWVAP